MPFLQSSGAISINDVRNLFGGPASPAMSNYYRGGSYVPATKTVSSYTREPGSGDYFTNWSWAWMVPVSGRTTIYATWNSETISNGSVPWSATSFSSGGWNYYRGGYRFLTSDGYINWYAYGIYRDQGTSYTVNINTGIPSSGQISLSQFYGAEKP